MFREVARKKQALTKKECTDILMEEKRGVLSVIGDEGYPYGMPLNHYYEPEDGKIYFHSGKRGHKIDSIKKEQKVSYCVMNSGSLSDDGWSLFFKSVVVFGKVSIIDDPDRAIDISRRLSLCFTNDEEYIDDEIRKAGDNVLVFCLTPEHITGKFVHEA